MRAPNTLATVNKLLDCLEEITESMIKATDHRWRKSFKNRHIVAQQIARATEDLQDVVEEFKVGRDISNVEKLSPR